jgi:putative transposase
MNGFIGGWSVIKATRRAGEREKGDERILGGGAFVSEIISQTEERIKHQVPSTDVDNLMTKEKARYCKREGVPVPLLQSGSRRSPLPKLRKILTQKLVNGYGVSLAETARQLGVSTSGISQIQILRRGYFVYFVNNVPQHTEKYQKTLIFL